MTTRSELKLGQSLVEEGLVSEEQIRKALAIQAAAQAPTPLGKILVAQKLITPRQLKIVLQRYNKRLKLGEVLLREGLITPEQLGHALEEQSQVKRPLGEVLVSLGFVSDEGMRQALCSQLDVPYVDLDRMEIDPALTRVINASYSRRHNLVPVSQVGQILTVSADDPTNVAVIEDLASTTGFIVNVVTSSHKSLQRAFQRLYDLPEPAATAGRATAAPEASSNLLETIELLDAAPATPAAAGLGRSRYVDDYIQGKRADDAVRQLLARGLERGCTDIHFETLATGAQVRFRVDGVLQETDLGALQLACDENAREIISRVKVLAKLDIAERRRPQDGAFRVRVARDGDQANIDLRVSIVPTYYGESCVLRLLDKKNAPTTIDQLGFSTTLSSRLRQLLRRPGGVFLVTGPTGSGKSTSLYACLMTTYRPEVRVLTAEDPIEYVYEQFSQSEVNDRIGNTFGRYLRAFLRHDPEVIMVGEIRDEETAEMAFRAAQTGHLLLSTLHSNDAVSSVTRLLDLRVDPNLLASSMIGVLAQRLVRQVCQSCRVPYTPSAELVREFFAAPPENVTFYKGAGCKACNFTGYRRRASIGELWVPGEEEAVLMSKSAPVEQLRATALRNTIPMARDVAAQLQRGQTNLEELIRVMPYGAVYEFRKLSATSGDLFLDDEEPAPLASPSMEASAG